MLKFRAEKGKTCNMRGQEFLDKNYKTYAPIISKGVVVYYQGGGFGVGMQWKD